jgi:hypothetical protein
VRVRLAKLFKTRGFKQEIFKTVRVMPIGLYRISLSRSGMKAETIKKPRKRGFNSVYSSN